MCWAKTQSRAEANPREMMGWSEYTFRMKTDVILHKAKRKKKACIFAQSSSRLAPGQRVSWRRSPILSLLENRSRKEKAAWILLSKRRAGGGGLTVLGRRRQPMRLSFHLMIGRQMAKEDTLEGRLRCWLILMQKFWRLRHTSCFFLA